MKPVEFKGCNVVYAEEHEEYLNLPGYKSVDGEVVSCWELTYEEIQEVIKTKRIYLSVMTFNQKLQPQLLSVKNPVK